MSAGGLVGYIFNLIYFAAIWTAVGVVFDKIGTIFNNTIHLMPTYQDAVNGFSMTQTIYGLLGVIVFLTLTVNCIMISNSASSGEV